MDMELIVKNAVRGVMESGTTREAGWGDFVRSLKKLVGIQDVAPANLNAMYDNMLNAAQATLRATNKAQRRMQQQY